MSEYAKLSPTVIDQVLESLAEGQTLAELARKHGFNRGWFYQVLEKDAELASRYARAREMQVEAWADDILREASEADDETNVQSARLRIDAKKWIMSKLVPRKYGDKLAVGGAEDLGPVQLSWKSRSTTPPETK